MQAEKSNEAEKREEKLKRTLWKLAHARQAMAHVLASCDFYLKHIANDEHPMHVPVLCAICTMYARPFTDNAGVGMISATFRKHSDPRLQKTHDMLWRSRKEFYAHSDATLKGNLASGKIGAIQPIDIVISRPVIQQGALFSFGYQLHELRVRGFVIPDVRDLCRELDSRLQREIQVTLDHLFRPRMPELARLFDERLGDQMFSA
jgi:hypothetical protein